jgi:beta-phosphoglucomutase-like phosphatase (HAD superfamily)
MTVGPVVIFDCDGTLLDTEPAYLEAESAIAREHGGVPLAEFVKVVPRLLGSVPMDCAKLVIEEFKVLISIQMPRNGLFASAWRLNECAA